MSTLDGHRPPQIKKKRRWLLCRSCHTPGGDERARREIGETDRERTTLSCVLVRFILFRLVAFRFVCLSFWHRAPRIFSFRPVRRNRFGYARFGFVPFRFVSNRCASFRFGLFRIVSFGSVRFRSVRSVPFRFFFVAFRSFFCGFTLLCGASRCDAFRFVT